MLLYDGKRLRLQYRTADSMFGVLRSDPKQVEIALDVIADARYSGGFLWLAPNIQLRVSDFTSIAQLPVAEAGRLEFKVRWSDRRDARRLIDSLSVLCAELRYQRLNEEISQMSASHPLGEARIAGRVSVPPPAPRAERESQ